MRTVIELTIDELKEVTLPGILRDLATRMERPLAPDWDNARYIGWGWQAQVRKGRADAAEEARAGGEPCTYCDGKENCGACGGTGRHPAADRTSAAGETDLRALLQILRNEAADGDWNEITYDHLDALLSALVDALEARRP